MRFTTSLKDRQKINAILAKKTFFWIENRQSFPKKSTPYKSEKQCLNGGQIKKQIMVFSRQIRKGNKKLQKFWQKRPPFIRV